MILGESDGIVLSRREITARIEHPVRISFSGRGDDASIEFKALADMADESGAVFGPDDPVNHDDTDFFSMIVGVVKVEDTKRIFRRMRNLIWNVALSERALVFVRLTLLGVNDQDHSCFSVRCSVPHADLLSSDRDMRDGTGPYQFLRHESIHPKRVRGEGDGVWGLGS